MKKIVLKAGLVCFTLLFLGACSTKRKGCGLTSDAKKIEARTTIDSNSVVTVK